MKCPECENRMKEVKAKIQDANSPVVSYQCGECGYFTFERNSINNVLNEIKENACVPDKKHIMLNIER